VVEEVDYHSAGEGDIPFFDGPVLPDVDNPKVGEWANLLKTDRTMGSLQYFEPKKNGGKTYVFPPDAVVEEGIVQWKSSLVGQFMDKPLPYFLVKKSVQSMWSQYGEIEIFSLENGIFIFRFQDEATCEEILENKLWHVANKPLILRKWQPGMQVLKLSLTYVPVWLNFFICLWSFGLPLV
jgi:hypothetical protein